MSSPPPLLLSFFWCVLVSSVTLLLPDFADRLGGSRRHGVQPILSFLPAVAPSPRFLGDVSDLHGLKHQHFFMYIYILVIFITGLI
jgi:hypothetical protein